jgi:hypothetical protein
MKKTAFPVFLVLLALASLACTLFVGGPDYPADPVAVSPDAAQSLRDQVRQAVEAGALGGPVTFQFNESQLTSFLADRLARETNPLLTEPKVLLRNGQIQVYGKFHRSIFAANVAVIMSAGVDPEGHPKIDVVSADFGPFPTPQALNSLISSFIDEAYTGALGPAATGFRLENITIADGLMILTGRLK